MKPKWFVRGDIDGFFGLALDNLVQLLLIDGLCRFVLGFPPELLYGKVLPGAAVSLLVGNLFYAWQARKLMEKTGRDDVCALPYGINTVSLFGHVFLVMLPAKLAALANHATEADAVTIAWHAGLIACMGSGVIELVGASVAERIRKATPRAALLSTLAGIALTFIAIGFLFRTFAHPIVGITTLGIVLLTYFGKVRFKGGIPGGAVAVVVGAVLCWVTGISPPAGPPPEWTGLHIPIPVVVDLVESFKHLVPYLPVIVPMGIFNVIGSLQNIESAEAAGDLYPTAPSLTVNGIGSVAAALFGSAFPTTIYIGHPGWKALGARAGYSILNGAFATVICLTGTLAFITYVIPVDAGMAIVLWIGIVITAQAFATTPKEHAPAVVVGLLPGVAGWGAFMAKAGLRAAGFGSAKPFTPDLVPEFHKADQWIDGAFALEQGFIFTSMILAAITVGIIERKFRWAAIWCFVAAAFSLLGIMHSYQWTFGDTTGDLLTPAVPFAIGYAIVGVLLVIAPWVTTESKAEGH